MHSIAASVVYNNFLGFIETIRLRMDSEENSVDSDYKKALIEQLDLIDFSYSFSESEIFETFVAIMRDLNLATLYC
jgi:hypothetical protein